MIKNRLVNKQPLSSTKQLPPLVSPRVPTKPQSVNFRSQKLKTDIKEEQRPATDKLSEKKKTLSQYKQQKQVSRPVLKQSYEQKQKRFQSPALYMPFLDHGDIQDEIVKEQTNRLTSMKNASMSSSGCSGTQDTQFSFSSSTSFTEGQLIGCGTFGKIYLAQENRGGKIYAIKKINSGDGVIQKEIEIMKTLQHPHIVKYFQSRLVDGYLVVYLEYMSQGNLTQLTQKHGPMDEDTIRLYTKQILMALVYLHDMRIIHRDIKGANILIDTTGIIKVGDFGESKLKEKTISLIKSGQNLLASLTGSLAYMSPEMVSQGAVTFSTDIWSLGCTILEMATAKLPWTEHNLEPGNAFAMMYLISEEGMVPYIPEHLSQNLQDFLKCCLRREANERWSASQLLKHSFMN